MKTVSVHAMFATPRNRVKKQWTEIKMYVISRVVKIWTMCFRMKDLNIMNVTAGTKKRCNKHKSLDDQKCQRKVNTKWGTLFNIPSRGVKRFFCFLFCFVNRCFPVFLCRECFNACLKILRSCKSQLLKTCFKVFLYGW